MVLDPLLSDGAFQEIRDREASISKGETPSEEAVSESEIKPLKALIDVTETVSFLAGMGYMVYGAYELITGHNPLTSFIVGAGLISVSELLLLATSAEDRAKDEPGIMTSDGGTGTAHQPDRQDDDGDDD